MNDQKIAAVRRFFHGFQNAACNGKEAGKAALGGGRRFKLNIDVAHPFGKVAKRNGIGQVRGILKTFGFF